MVSPKKRIDPRAEVEDAAPPAETGPEAHLELAIERGPEGTNSERELSAASVNEGAPADGVEPLTTTELLAKVEPLVKETRWVELVELLERRSPADLPPALRLVLAVALVETSGEGSSTVATRMAIQAFGALLGLPEESGTTVVLTKRIVRRNPIAWRKRQAPPAPIRLALVITALALGIVAGWALGPGYNDLPDIIEVVFRK
jgi:hypothetical protein